MSPQSQKKFLFVLTSHSELGNSGKPTGWYLPEFAHPYEVLAPHLDITIASPAGGTAPLDPGSVDASKDDKISMQFHQDKENLWKETEKLSSFVGRAGEFEGIFVVGGHGPMFDLAKDATSQKLINEFYAQDKIVSAVCHGPAALAFVKTPSGASILADSAVTGFANSEEDLMGFTSTMPFKLEDALNEASGGKFTKAGSDFGEKVVVARDGKLITGQNPASATGVGKAIYTSVFGGSV